MATKLGPTQERLREVVSYDPDTGIFTRLISVPFGPAGSQCGCKNLQGYVVFRVDGNLYYAHRLAWLYVHGEWPETVDHINGDRADNRIANLRSASQTVNMWNARTSVANTSGLKGVSRMKNGKWKAQISVDNRNQFIGNFSTREAAYAAYFAAAVRLRGFVSYDLRGD